MALSLCGILPMYKPDKYLARAFRYTEKVLSFYKDLVDRQDLAAYREAITGTL
jgi:hypothetical protein